MTTPTDAMRVYHGPALARYGFGEGHPFGPDRQGAFLARFRQRGLDARVQHGEPVQAGEDALLAYHTREYVDFVRARSAAGEGYLDCGDTPVVPGIHEAALTVVGTTLAAARAVLDGACSRAFTPIAGLHHARRDAAAGFCVYNDVGVLLAHLLGPWGLARVAYVDIDAHHGDGVYYDFEEHPGLIIADFHEDGRYLYPGTGHRWETGRGPGHGNKRNFPLLPGADDRAFLAAWEDAEALVAAGRPELILLQCGADSLAGDPITHLQLTTAAHGHAARRLRALADAHCEGRLVAMGGGGYDRGNLAAAWCAVVEALL
jgi:acetoin utilization protein AcuC